MDQASWWSTDRHCGLGHRRLSIIDLSDRASQPMASDDGRFVIVFNGEIYNYPELRTELEKEAPTSARLPTRRRSCISTRVTAPRWYIGSAACSLLLSGTRHGVACSWRAIPTGSSRSTLE